MPLWLIYGFDVLTTIAVAVMALAVALILAGRVHLLTIDTRINGQYLTHYMVAVGRRKNLPRAVHRWQQDMGRREAPRHSGQVKGR